MNRPQLYFHLTRHILFDRRRPLWALINLTNKCLHLHCQYCNLPESSQKSMSTDIVFSLIEQCHEIGIKLITLSGGEPLIRDDIMEIVKYIKSKKMDLRIATEGGVDYKKMEALKYADLVDLSFDGPRDVHDKQRYIGSYDNFLQNSSFLKENKVRFRCICVMTKANLNYIDKILEFALTEKFDVFFQPITNTYFYRGGIPGELELTVEEIRILGNKLLGLKRNSRYLANSWMMLRHLADPSFRYRCYARTGFFYAHFDGAIYHCWAYPTEPLGNIHSEKLQAILEKPSRLDQSKCDCTSYSLVEKNYLIDLFPLSCLYSRYL